VFSLGAVLAFAATGERPFGTGTPIALLDRVIHDAPSIDKVPAEVRPLVQRCLAKDASERPTPASLLAELGALQAATDWLPESIIRMFPREIPLKGEDDWKGGGIGSTLTVTLGSAAQDPAVLPRQAKPSAPAKPNDQLRTDTQPRDGNPMPPTDQLRIGHRVQPDDHVQPGGQPPAGDLRQPGGQLQPDDQRELGDPPQAADQLQRDDQAQTGDQPQLGDQAETGDQLRPDDRVQTDGQTQAVDQTEPDDRLVPGDQPRWGDSGRRKPRSPSWRPLAAACVVGALLAASSAASYALITAIRHSGKEPATASASTSASPSVPARTPSGPLDVSRVYTYQQGVMVYIDIYYTDQGNNADGFGFTGADGSPIGEVNYPFSSPAAGIIETGSITYPFNEGCGTAQQRSDSVEVWVNDAAGARSPAKVVHLACAS
jgi:hypothetical protein